MFGDQFGVGRPSLTAKNVRSIFRHAFDKTIGVNEATVMTPIRFPGPQNPSQSRRSRAVLKRF
jgi:hypothetical protein